MAENKNFDDISYVTYHERDHRKGVSLSILPKEQNISFSVNPEVSK